MGSFEDSEYLRGLIVGLVLVASLFAVSHFNEGAPAFKERQVRSK